MCTHAGILKTPQSGCALMKSFSRAHGWVIGCFRRGYHTIESRTGRLGVLTRLQPKPCLPFHGSASRLHVIHLQKVYVSETRRGRQTPANAKRHQGSFIWVSQPTSYARILSTDNCSVIVPHMDAGNFEISPLHQTYYCSLQIYILSTAYYSAKSPSSDIEETRFGSCSKLLARLETSSILPSFLGGRAARDRDKVNNRWPGVYYMLHWPSGAKFHSRFSLPLPLRSASFLRHTLLTIDDA